MPTRAALPVSQTTNSIRSALSSRLRPLSIVCIGHENDICLQPGDRTEARLIEAFAAAASYSVTLQLEWLEWLSLHV